MCFIQRRWRDVQSTVRALFYSSTSKKWEGSGSAAVETVAVMAADMAVAATAGVTVAVPGRAVDKIGAAAVAATRTIKRASSCARTSFQRRAATAATNVVAVTAVAAAAATAATVAAAVVQGRDLMRCASRSCTTRRGFAPSVAPSKSATASLASYVHSVAGLHGYRANFHNELWHCSIHCARGDAGRPPSCVNASLLHACALGMSSG